VTRAAMGRRTGQETGWDVVVRVPESPAARHVFAPVRDNWW
jgi:hypothetical protein